MTWTAAPLRWIRSGPGSRRPKRPAGDALDELRRILGVLRFGPGELEPAPRLAELGGLCRAITGAGVHVGLEVPGNLDAVPPGVGLSCYRIVQEALTNTLKHSGARNAWVSVRGDGREV